MTPVTRQTAGAPGEVEELKEKVSTERSKMQKHLIADTISAGGSTLLKTFDGKVQLMQGKIAADTFTVILAVGAGRMKEFMGIFLNRSI